MIPNRTGVPGIMALLIGGVMVACGGRGVSTGSPAPSTASRGVAVPFTSITIERSPCFGTCPVYRMAVGGDGVVKFEGVRHVDSVGHFTGRIDAAKVAELKRLFDDTGYASFLDRYVEGAPGCGQFASDAPTVTTSITAGTSTKRIEHNLGCSTPPRALATLERRVDEIVGTLRWIGRR